MDNLTQDQSAALAEINSWANETDSRGFFLDGKAGTGKTYLISALAQMFIDQGRYVAALAPTHKAVNVINTKLKASGLEVVELEKSKKGPMLGRIYCGTHSSFLGIAPVIAEDQDKEQKFDKVSQGRVPEFETFPGSTLLPAIVFMDECSMLSKPGLRCFTEAAEDYNLKFVFVGDMGQLPPVKAQPANFNKARHQYTLTEVVRQGADSKILALASRIREQKPYKNKLAKGAYEQDVRVYTGDVGHGSFLHEFLERVRNPVDLPEEERTVFLAYRNKVVDEMNELACQKVYNHGMEEFRAGERVVAIKPILGDYDPKLRFRPIVAQTNEELEIKRFSQNKYAVPCAESGLAFDAFRVTVAHKKGSIVLHFVNEEDLTDDHPYNVELEARHFNAVGYQKEFNTGIARIDKELLAEGFSPDGKEASAYWTERRQRKYALEHVDKQRRIAWARFFEWRDATLCHVRHLFAYTTHKSQGSTFKEVFVDYKDIEKFGRGDTAHKSLYVAVTRPSNVVHLLV